jgi:predicted nucleic acid-binding protein
MRLLIDTNIIFSALLNKHSSVLQVLESQRHHTYYCLLSTIEIFSHKEKILRLSKLAEEELLSTYAEVLNRLEAVHERDIPAEIRAQALRLCEGTD